MATAAQTRAERKRSRKEREKARREADRKLLGKLRDSLKDSKRMRRDRVREVVASCRAMRHVAREHARALRARYRALVRAQIEGERQASREKCELNKAEARAQAAPAIKRALDALEAERNHQATLRRWSKHPTSKRARAGRISSISESDSEVEANLPADMIPVWRKVKHRLRASPRRTRTETFVEWAAEHAAEVARLQDAQLEDEIAELVAREAELRERTGTTHYYRNASDSELDAVPF